MPIYRLTTTIPNTSAAQLFAWHERPGAFDRLNPPFDPVRVLSREGQGVAVGTRLHLEAKVGPVPVRWVAEHTACAPGSGFTDVQRSGPFSRWEHHHRFRDQGDDASLEDEIHWEAPLGGLGSALGGIEARLDRAFAFRHRRTAQDLARHRPYPGRRLRIALTGSTGLVGTELTAFLDAGGHEVVPLVRDRDRPGIYLSPLDGSHDPGSLDGFDAVVHLAGAPIATEAWTPERKEVIRDSRVRYTRVLVEALSRASDPPSVLVSGSAVGVYGDAGDRVCTEASEAGDTFLASVCTEWEAAAAAAADAMRVVQLRTGYVLSARGGLLKPMLPLFRLGLGGPVGTGRQFMPWIHIDDLVGLIHRALMDDAIRGPINGTAPEPVRQADFARALGRAMGRPALAPGPAAMVRLALGRERADELVLQGQRAVPHRATQLGFTWWHTDLEAALRIELGHPAG